MKKKKKVIKEANLGNISNWGNRKLNRQTKQANKNYYQDPYSFKNVGRYNATMNEKKRRDDAWISQQNLQGITGQGGDAMSRILSQIQNQGAFNPTGLKEFGNYGEWRQKAQDEAMSYFDRNNATQFKREEDDFRQMMENQGVAPGTARYDAEFRNMKDAQERQRLNAMSSAFSAGQAEQAQQFGQTLQGNDQMYNQQYQTYQTPYANMGAMMPFYETGIGQFQNWDDQNNQNNQNAWAAFMGDRSAIRQIQEQGNQQRQTASHQRSLIPTGRSGGGGYSPSYYDQYLADIGNQMNQVGAGQSGAGQSFVSGFGSGAISGGLFGGR